MTLQSTNSITTVYTAIFDFITTQGYAPTNAELLALVHIEHGRVFEAIHWLESKGLVYREGRQWRNLRLTGKVCDCCGDPLQPDTIVLKKNPNGYALRKCCHDCWNEYHRNWYDQNQVIAARKSKRWYQNNKVWWNEQRSELRKLPLAK